MHMTVYVNMTLKHTLKKYTLKKLKLNVRRDFKQFEYPASKRGKSLWNH